MDYKTKYLKYKSKYLQLKKSQSAGKKTSPFNYTELGVIVDPDNVKNEQDFIEFLNHLWKEKVLDDKDIIDGKVIDYTNGNYGWAHNTIATFLEAMLSGYEGNTVLMDEKNPWTKIANIIYLGKIYE